MLKMTCEAEIYELRTYCYSCDVVTELFSENKFKNAVIHYEILFLDTVVCLSGDDIAQTV